MMSQTCALPAASEEERRAAHMRMALAYLIEALPESALREAQERLAEIVIFHQQKSSVQQEESVP